MRPDVDVEGDELYECIDCGERAAEPDSRVCASCGGKLENISRSRDL
jgi:rRNA maturation endonuclease Nob1